jgi:hypothetical protein
MRHQPQQVPFTTHMSSGIANLFIYQIYYNAETRESLDPDFLPLDNSGNERPDWYEFWVIRKFLLENELQEDGWYGFLSPNFGNKTGLTGKEVSEFVKAWKEKSDVILICSGWDQIAYFQNPFEQGEFWHPGIFDLSQEVMNQLLAKKVDLKKMVSHTGNFTFSNYVIARSSYWQKWLQIANNFFDMVEDESHELSSRLKSATQYGSSKNLAPIKTFMQERLATIVISQNHFDVACVNSISSFPIFEAIFEEEMHTRGLLQTCDLLKRQYCESNDTHKLELYREIRQLIKLRPQALQAINNINTLSERKTIFSSMRNLFGKQKS